MRIQHKTMMAHVSMVHIDRDTHYLWSRLLKKKGNSFWLKGGQKKWGDPCVGYPKVWFMVVFGDGVDCVDQSNRELSEV